MSGSVERMPSQEFDARVARLEEHLVPRTAEEHLRRAEEQLARGDELLARHSLMLAKIVRERERDPDES